MAASIGHLALERRETNLAFSSWRLSSSIARAEGSLALPSPAAAAQASDTDYVTARHVALLNGLTQQPCGCYTFLEEEPAGGSQLSLYQLDLGEPGQAPALRRVCGLPAQQPDTPPGGVTAGCLPPSVVEVQAGAAAGPTAANTSGATPSPPSSSSSSSGSLLLVSRGQGDVSLVVKPPAAAAGEQQQPAMAATLSPPVCPLRPPSPLQGVRPVHLAAAFLLPAPAATPDAAPSSSSSSSGASWAAGEAPLEICCILWAACPRSGRQASRCEVFAVHLAAVGIAEPALRVLDVQLLKVSDLPPHGMLVNPSTGGVLLALQPSSASAEEEAAAQRAAAAAVAQAREKAAASGASGQAEGMGAGDDDDDDDVSPRTLAAAVARLAAYTSEEPVGALPHQQYADLYRETGSDGIGAMGAEPTCTLFTFAVAGRGPASPAHDAEQAGGAASGAAQHEAQQGGQQGQLLRLVHTLSCQPHKLLTCHLVPSPFGAQEPSTPDTHLAEGGSREAAHHHHQRRQQAGRCSSGHTLLLGLTDDVDCAVVAVSCCSGGASGEGEGGSGGSGENASAGFVIQHVSSIPAMAYVAAGKVQRKFLLLARPGGDLAAALVEASKYCYLYRSTALRQEYGEHQVVDMELPDSSGRGLLGAVLAGSRAGACRLVLLAREGLRVIDM